MNVWELSLHAKFRGISSYFNLFSQSPTNFGLVAALFIQRRTGLPMNEPSSDANLTALYCSY